MKDLQLNANSIKYIIQQLYKLDLNQSWRLSFTPWKEKRGLSSNSQIHVWFSEIAKQKGDETALDVKNFCKDAIGLPILLNSAKHGDKLEFLLCKLGYYKHSHESKMKLIQCLEVTSLFTTSEMKEFMEQMIFYWNENGFPIKFKD